jgi:hypothetical protein
LRWVGSRFPALLAAKRAVKLTAKLIAKLSGVQVIER